MPESADRGNPFDDPEKFEQLKALSAPELFEEFISEIYDYAYRLGMKLTQKAARAEELAEDTVVIFAQAYKKIKSGRALKAWVFRVVENLERDYAKKTERAARVFDKSISDWIEDDEECADPLNPLSVLCDKERSDELELEITGVLQSLPSTQRTCLTLTVFENLPAKRVAVLMGKTEDAVNQLKRRALVRLSRHLRLKQLYHEKNSL